MKRTDARGRPTCAWRTVTDSWTSTQTCVLASCGRTAGRSHSSGNPLALAVLVRHAGRLVTRDELRTAIWPDDTHVDFARGLNYCIRQVSIRPERRRGPAAVHRDNRKAGLPVHRPGLSGGAHPPGPRARGSPPSRCQPVASEGRGGRRAGVRDSAHRVRRVPPVRDRHGRTPPPGGGDGTGCSRPGIRRVQGRVASRGRQDCRGRAPRLALLAGVRPPFLTAASHPPHIFSK